MLKDNFSYIALLLVMLSIPAFIFSQNTIINGVVYDTLTQEPIPFANVVFKHSTIGTITDINGKYTIRTTNPKDTLIATCLGYELQKVHVRKGAYQTIDFYLHESRLAIEEVVVTPGENPAFRILDNIKARKKINNPERFNSYQYKSYNKLRLDLNNIDQEFKDQRLMKQFQFVFDHMDSSEVFAKNYLPILISESVSHYYHQKTPSVEKEVIEAFKISGIENNTISQFSGKMYQKLNVYDNFISLFEPGFVSPIADFGRMYYKYYLEDSANIDGNWCHKISFKPKRKKERTFYGYFWVADTSWAIKKIQLRVSSDVNINFMNDLVAINEYKKLNDTIWFLNYEELLIDFNINDKSYGFIGRKQASYSDIVINEPVPDEIQKLLTNTYYDEDSIIKGDHYWEGNRVADLSEEDANIYEMVDSVKQVPMFKTLYGIFELLFDYYYVIGNVELGPYYTFYSHNTFEGHRLKFGMRTSNNFSTTYRLGGYVAYGLGDQDWKYGLTLEYMFNKNPRKKLMYDHFHDVKQLGKSNNAFLDDNILETVLRRRPNYKLTMVNFHEMSYEREWFQGFSNTFVMRYAQVFPTEYIPFEAYTENGGTESLSHISTTEFTLKTHFAYQEKFMLGRFDRKSLGSIYPTLGLELTYAPKGILGSTYEYVKVKAEIKDKVEINPIGFARYRLAAGKIFGNVAYPLLELHEGNETYAYDQLAFNMMNYYEFASDQYASLWVEHHFQGFFLNRIPLIRALEWREVVSGKMVIGSLSDANQHVMVFPENLYWFNDPTLDRSGDIRFFGIKPYVEAGMGVENIFKLFRVEATWRLAYRNNPEIQKFGVRVMMQLTF
jgi:hypothetical protein